MYTHIIFAFTNHFKESLKFSNFSCIILLGMDLLLENSWIFSQKNFKRTFVMSWIIFMYIHTIFNAHLQAFFNNRANFQIFHVHK